MASLGGIKTTCPWCGKPLPRIRVKTRVVGRRGSDLEIAVEPDITEGWKQRVLDEHPECFAEAS